MQNQGTDIESSNLLLPSDVLSKKLISDEKGFDEQMVNEHLSINQFNGFRIQNINFLVDVKVGCHVSLHSQIYPMPNTPKSMLGVCSHKGSIIPVFCFHQYFFDTERRVKEKNQAEYLLIFGSEEAYIAILSDTFPSRIDFNQSELETRKFEVNEKLQNALLNIYKDVNGDAWFELDCELFFPRLSID